MLMLLITSLEINSNDYCFFMQRIANPGTEPKILLPDVTKAFVSSGIS